MKSTNRTEYEWLALRCQAGEPGAFEDLIAVMERPLLYYAASLTGNQDTGLDVLQDVYQDVKPYIYRLTGVQCAVIAVRIPCS
jgi:DNA-directed RNA polymerase specialized sigma24 family protein